MPNTDLTQKNIQQETESILGGSGVAVELSDADYSKATRDAIREYNRNVPRISIAALPVSSSQVKYPIIKPGLIGVTYVDFVGNGIQFGASTEFGVPFSNLSPTGLGIAGGATFGEINTAAAYAKQAQQIASAEPEWLGQWEQSNYYLYIYVQTTMGTVNCSYTYSWGLTPDNNATTGMQLIPLTDVQWVLDYVACRCKQMVARVRGKFRGIPDAQGGTSPTDADYLLEEGKAEEAALKEDIRGRRRPIAPIMA